ncbi:RING finger protein [Gossypium arboreum]|uniref:RING-type E3 ubiquitin transferase n=1 Tax=Gossypium arboreum TaxID=29729 RepID=A0A0B0P881_GOSAR|nr:RING finger protein [Gossypium arboreum]
MDGYTGKRAVNGLVPGKGSGLILKDHVNIREQNPQFCNRIGCSRRLNSTKGTPNCYSGKAKCSKPSYHPSSSGKEIIGSSSGVYTEVSNTRKSSTNILRKLSSQLEIDSSETSSVQEEPEVSELLSPLGKIQGGLQPESEDSDSGEVAVLEVGSSSVASNTKRGRSFIQNSRLGNQDTLASPSVTLASRSAFQATQGNTSKYGLRNLGCDSISVVAPAGCSSSDSSFSRRKNSVKKRDSEGESSSSTWGKKLSGSSPEGLNNSSSLSVSISDSRRARNWSSNRDCGIASSVRTQRSNSSYGRGRLPNQANGNSLTLNESPIVIPQAPQSHIRTDMNALVPIETASTRTSSYSRSGSIDESLRSFMPSSPSEVSGYHSSVNRGSFQHYNMDGFAEELLALEERMGTVSTAVPEAALSKCLKSGIYKATSLEDANVRFEGEKNDIKCSICQEEYVIGDEVGRLHCEHRYHIACIQKWLRMKNWCPICKASAEPTQSCSPTSYLS